jgi:hypothetical protein
MAVAASLPALSQAETVLTVDGPSNVAMPDGAAMDFAVESDLPGTWATIVYDHNWNYVGGCDPNVCSYTIWPWLVEGGGHDVTETFHIRASNNWGGSTHFSNVVDQTITFHPPDWHVDLDMPSAVSAPDPIPATLSVTPALSSPRSANLLNADNNQWTGFSCPTLSGVCEGAVDSWWVSVPTERHFRAELVDGATVLSHAERTVTVYPPNIGVTISVPPAVGPGHSYTVRVTNTYNRWTPYTIIVRDGNGNVVGWCGVDAATCEFTATAGATGTTQSFTAEVASGSTIISKTSPAKVEAADPASAGSIDGIDITALAALFGSASSVCDSLLYFPGTNLTNTSTSDQEDACLVASEASGATAEDVIRAALAAMAAAGGAASGQSLLAWLQHYAWENWGTTAPPHPPGTAPGHPTSPPPSTPAPVASAVDALADSLTARNAAVAALGAAAATEIARHCLNLTGDDGISSDDCKNLPIFMPGSDVVGATNHRIQALASHPAWVKLTRRVGPTDPWYRSQVECVGLSSYLDCDEFPENRTYQGGSRGAAVHRPSLEPVNWIDNQQLGGRFGNFLVTCGIKDGEAFLEVPLPPGARHPDTDQHLQLVTDTSPRLLTNELLTQLSDKLEAIGAPVTEHWRPGLQDHEMDAMTSTIGISLSTEARVWWAWHDGVDLARSPAYSSFGPGWDAYSLAYAIDDAKRMRQIAAMAARDQPEFHNQDWADSWIALCGDVSYRRLACDCAVPSGAPSTVHYFDPSDNMEPARPKARSIGDLVHVWLDALNDGTWHIDPETSQFALRDPTELLRAKGSDIADLL